MKDIISKAVDGGMRCDLLPDNYEINNLGNAYWLETDDGESIWIERIIFSHEFLRAYFGEEETCLICGQWFMRKCTKDTSHKLIGTSWQYHAQILVLEKDRISYLRRYL